MDSVVIQNLQMAGEVMQGRQILDVMMVRTASAGQNPEV